MSISTQIPEYPMQRAPGCPFDPPPALAKVHHSTPISRVRLWDNSTPWLITSYQHVRDILRDPRVSADPNQPGFPHTTQASKARLQQEPTFIHMDGAEHIAGRRLLTSEFTVKKMQALRPRIQDIVDNLIDDMLAGPKPVDLVKGFALPVALLVICEMIGVPYADRELFHRNSEAIHSASATPEQMLAASAELRNYLGELVERRSGEPSDDLLSRLAVEQLRTGNMSGPELGRMGMLLLVGGHATTANMIALGTALLLSLPDQLQIIRTTDDPQLIETAVEELLRYLTIPQLGRRRVALQDIEIGGQLIRAGEGIIAAADIANRDESAYPNPDHVDLQRQAPPNLAFSEGVHQCLGQRLARLELQVVYSTLYRRIPYLALAIPFDELEFKHDMAFYGVRELPVTW
ncbi:cytochrome P450 [Mycobacteroides abscessus subsp. massiliense]|uniref:cytochrome P450 n=1 Tax=Mycobacteroides abscessus TaxID=36809 RepID=UPI0009A8E560|nr:cytochrome P450 [Mycobacteroides abscessus]SKR20870.1 cytochrome P450 [Mycobacteroides abscessus subsp. massiliense]SKR37749.1 cytochrome P450 [Mycobacteroides abscessus subsp. massiliense]SKT44688.1 cytochrome P450 [Mycobacteroides abscessus subsp. massiliense]SKT66738.1 cytochrome P450 [Mycobacteroides abscessus subsp. massiliense]SLA06696.1 cytochrome P450 [Mycobacteroides abscessus subsp. massiliense]